MDDSKNHKRPKLKFHAGPRRDAGDDILGQGLFQQGEADDPDV